MLREFVDPVLQQGRAGPAGGGPLRRGGHRGLQAGRHRPGGQERAGRRRGHAGPAAGRRRRRSTAPGSTCSPASTGTRRSGSPSELLANPVIQTVAVADPRRVAARLRPTSRCRGSAATRGPRSRRVDLGGDDDALLRISRERLLALSLREMHAIRDHFRARRPTARRGARPGLGADPTDAELECLAQTWSEHCKHKIFNATITYEEEGRPPETIRSLFKTYIKRRDRGDRRASCASGTDAPGWSRCSTTTPASWPSTTQVHLVYKVETHNSPSALDPYGGAITGIVGVNRDPFGTGLGAELLVNVWGYCFASPVPRGRAARGPAAPAAHPRRRARGRDRRRQPERHPLRPRLGALRRPLPGQAAGLLRHGRRAAGHRRRAARRGEGRTCRAT